jgi:hypothetical protein
MRWSDLPLKPSARMLRQFAGLWILFFGGLAVWNGWRQAETRALVFAVLALTVGPAGLIWPSANRPVFVGWLIVAFPIGWLVWRVLLVTLFGLMVPVAVVFRLRGRDALGLRRRTDKASYWMPKPQAENLRSYLRQF